MGAQGYDRFTLTQALGEFDKLDWQPLGPDSPEVGDAIKYRDGSVAVVGTYSHVSYGPREEMVAVARLIRSDEAKTEESPATEPESKADKPKAVQKAKEPQDS